MENEKIISDSVRKKLKEGNKKVLLEHKSGWIILYDKSFNFCVFNLKDLSLGNQNRWKKGNVPNNNVSYYGKIEDAISEVYRRLVVFYKCDDVSLLSSIKKAKTEIFAVLNDIRSLVELEV